MGWFTGDRALILQVLPTQPALIVDFRQEHANQVLDLQQHIPTGAVFTRFVKSIGWLAPLTYINQNLRDLDGRGHSATWREPIGDTPQWILSSQFAAWLHGERYYPSGCTLNVGFWDVMPRPNGLQITAHYTNDSGLLKDIRQVIEYDVPQNVLDFVAGITASPLDHLNL